MGILDKVPFLKKKEDPFSNPNSGLSDDPFKTDIGSDHLNSPDPLAGTSPYDNPNLDSMQQTQDDVNNQMHDSLMPPAEAPQNLPGQPVHQQPQYTNKNSNSNNVIDNKTELILSKLDTIKLNIENINLRLNKIENEIQTQKNPKHSW